MSVNFFLILVALHWELYLLALGLSAAVLFPVFKRHTLGWFDPLRFTVLLAIFANAVPVFLVFTRQMDLPLFTYFVLAETLFWIGIVQMSRKRSPLSRVRIQYAEQVGYYLFLIFFSLYVLFTLASYALLGIPLFSDESRLSAFANSGGMGILARFNNFFSIYSLLYAFYLIYKKEKQWLAATVILVAAIFLIFTGSKAAFLSELFAYWGFSIFILRKVPRSKYIAFFLILGSAFAILIIFFQTLKDGGNWATSSLNFIARFIASGDSYFYAYPDQTYTVVETGEPFTYLFSGLLKTLRIIPNDATGPSIGNQLAWQVNASSIGQDVGPNSRMPLLSYLLWGWSGLFLSYVAGATIGFLLFRLPHYLPQGIISAAFVTYVYIMTCTGISDFILLLNYAFDFALNFSLLILLIFLLTRQLDKNKPQVLID